MTEQRVAEAQLARRATHDPLTGLTTRAVFLDFVTRALAKLPRTSGLHAVALFLDLDRLKYVNDTFGHAVGDVVLAEFASRVRSAVRPSDVVARVGGDEFAVLLEDVEHPRESREVAQRILDVLAAPFETNGRRVEIRASIGIAVSASDRVTSSALLAHADAAMYRAKQRGRGRYELFDEDAYTAAMRRQNVEGELRTAASAWELSLHYQPMLDLGTGQLTGVEALLRWQHPVRGLLPAADFIAVAEEGDLLRPLTGWLFTTACDQMAEWDRSLGSAAPQHLYVNLAGSQLGHEHVVRTIAAAIHASGISPGRLNLEITETQMFDDPVITAQSVAELRTLGCNLIVDDFGTGYSSLSRLTQMPVSGLKIDRSFVRSITTSREFAAIAASVVLLAHNLRHIVVAEGVETAEELTAVTELGCHLAQGYFIARPAPPSELVAVFRRGAALGQLPLS